MSEPFAQIEIPKRALFKAVEVCDIVKVQPYVLRSWEAEFPELGVTKTTGGPRVYRRADVEQVLRIKHLLLVEGLTLAGARRRLEEEATPVAVDAPAIDELIGQNARERLTEVRRGLRSILELLARTGVGDDLRLAAPTPAIPGGIHGRSHVRRMAARRPGLSREKTSPSRNGSRTAHHRRKRSA